MKSSTMTTDWIDSGLKGLHSCVQIAAYWIPPPSWPRRVLCDFFPSLCNASQSSKISSILFLFMMTYLAIMDLILYSYFRQADLADTRHKGNPDEMYSPFTHLTVKALVSDEPDQFLLTPSAEYFNSITHFSSVFPFITPNMISTAHLICAYLSGKFVASGILKDRQIGAALFCFRSWLDALDGVVFRAQSNRRLQFGSFKSSAGYFIDGFFDLIGSFFLCFGVLFYLIKRFGPKKYHRLPLWSRSSNSSASDALLVENNGSSSSDVKETVPESSNDDGEQTYSLAYLSSKAFILGLCLGIGGWGWTHSMESLTNIFQTELKDENLSMLQYQYCHSYTTIIIFIAWRLLGRIAIQNYIVLAVFFDWIWELLKGPHVIILCLSAVMFGLTEIYIRHLRSVLQL